MKVILMSTTNFQVIELSNVSNIAYDAATNTFTITHSGGATGTYSGASYHVNILW